MALLAHSDGGASLDELFPSEFQPLGQRDLNLLSPGSSPLKALNTFAWRKEPRGSSMDIDGDIDLDQLLDEEMQQPPQYVSQHDDDELEALLEQEAEMERAKPALPLLQSNGLLDRPCPPPLLVSNGLLSSFEMNTPVADILPISSSILSEPESVLGPNESAPVTQMSAPASNESGPSRATIPKYIPAGYFNATTMDGKPIRFERRKRLTGWKPPQVMDGVDASQLLSRPIHQLLEAVEALKALDVVEQAEAQETSSTPVVSQMWVDKYRPSKFTELLGDERVHRDVLGWLKEWDRCVFKRQNLRKERHQQYIQAKFGDSSTNVRYGNADNPPWKDPYGRPKERVLMMSGPPGLGKTTLAHIIGKHAGYNVYELNASDARTAGAVEDIVKTALESGSLTDSRPTLVVIDEIDGATGGGGGASGDSAGFIRALVRLIEEGQGTKSGKLGKGAGQGKKRAANKPLLRPIICICNDVYAPALRPLRPLAKLVRFKPPGAALVVKRLRDICEAEDMRVEARGLSLLSELTNGDMRACLNALEFAKTKQMAVTEAAVREAAVGIKDTGSSVHKAWEVLFRRQNRKEKVNSSIGARSAETSAPWNSTYQGTRQTKTSALVDTPQENVNRIVHEVAACSEYEKLAQGCFEHYPSLRTSDDGWERFGRAHDWLHFGQSLNDRAFKYGNYELLGFMPWSFVCWHLLFANVGNPLPDYPKADYENHLKVTAFKELATEVITALPDNVRSQFSRESVVTELGPFLMRILTPDLRPVNSQLARPEDKQIMASLIAIMSSLKINFVQDRDEAGQLVYKLDPQLDIFTQFDGQRSKETGPARFAVRQMVVKEMERVKLRIDDGSTAKLAIAAYRNGASNDKKLTEAVDFFGRPIAKVDAVKVTVKRDEPIKVFYRYHEGFSNAVRRPMKISALLG